QVGMTATRKLLPPFEQGHFEFEYKVLAAAIWNGVSIPSSSILRKYVPLPDATSSGDVCAAVVTQLKVDSIHAGAWRPSIGQRKLVAYDNRLPKGSKQAPAIF